MTSQLAEQPWPWSPRGGLIKAAAAAQRAGLSIFTFLGACERGDIPVKLERVGRFVMVRSDELEAWLSPHQKSLVVVRDDGLASATEENLFQETPA